MIPFNYHHLYYFYVIAHEGSIARATQVLRLAQPTLSAQLKQFERFLKVQLFIRENKRLILTEEGHRVLAYAKTIFDIGQELKDRMVDLSHKEGRLRIQIGTTNAVPKTIVELMLDYLLKIEPSVFIQLEKDNPKKLLQDLDDHLLDIVITDSPFDTAIKGDLQHKFIGKIPIAFCAAPAIAKQIRRFPQDLNGRPMILPAAPRQLFYDMQEYFHEHHISPEIIAEIQDLETVRRLALRGHGIAPINLLTIKGAPSRQQLIILNKPSECDLYEKIFLITKKRKMQHPLAERLLTSFSLENYLKGRPSAS